MKKSLNENLQPLSLYDLRQVVGGDTTGPSWTQKPAPGVVLSDDSVDCRYKSSPEPTQSCR
jgi:hypothetical protein